MRKIAREREREEKKPKHKCANFVVLYGIKMPMKRKFQ